MFISCRYCDTARYPIPELGSTTSKREWKGEWAHVECYLEAREKVRTIVARFMTELRQASVKRRSKQK